MGWLCGARWRLVGAGTRGEVPHVRERTRERERDDAERRGRDGKGTDDYGGLRKICTILISFGSRRGDMDVRYL